jgi:uncharacterized repeat protein (TIGR03803 family)
MKPSEQPLCGVLAAAMFVGLGLISAGEVKAQTFTTLHNFGTVQGDGGGPVAGLLLSGSTLYGTTTYGGDLDEAETTEGMIFSVHTNDTAFTNLHSFSVTDVNGFNNDGDNPCADLILSRETLYGTAQHGGSAGNGTVFAVNTNGTGFTALYSFSATNANGFNTDGANPFAGLILSGGILYGTTTYGGGAGNGTVFAINTNGTGFTNLYSFSATDANGVNNDGANPYADSILSGNTLYGVGRRGRQHRKWNGIRRQHQWHRLHHPL